MVLVDRAKVKGRQSNEEGISQKGTESEVRENGGRKSRVRKEEDSKEGKGQVRKDRVYSNRRVGRKE